jgi:hypothetical protein
MFDRSDGFPALIGVMAARISVPFVFEPQCHAWTKSRQSYVTIPDDARQYAENFTPQPAPTKERFRATHVRDSVK